MAILTRDHENAELRHRELKERKMAADMDVQMIEDHKGERLVVISPPDLPQHTHPHGILIFLGGIFLSFCGAAAMVVIAQILSQAIVGERQLTAFTGVSPLVCVPHIYTAEEARKLSHHTYLEMLQEWLSRGRHAYATAMPPKGDQ